MRQPFCQRRFKGAGAQLDMIVSPFAIFKTVHHSFHKKLLMLFHMLCARPRGLENRILPAIQPIAPSLVELLDILHLFFLFLVTGTLLTNILCFILLFYNIKVAICRPSVFHAGTDDDFHHVRCCMHYLKAYKKLPDFYHKLSADELVELNTCLPVRDFVCMVRA